MAEARRDQTGVDQSRDGAGPARLCPVHGSWRIRACDDSVWIEGLVMQKGREGVTHRPQEKKMLPTQQCAACMRHVACGVAFGARAYGRATTKPRSIGAHNGLFVRGPDGQSKEIPNRFGRQAIHTQATLIISNAFDPSISIFISIAHAGLCVLACFFATHTPLHFYFPYTSLKIQQLI